MERIYVESSMITSIGYDPQTATLEIEFKSGAVWQYRDFSENEWYEFRSSDSKGKFFHSNIKNKFNEDRVG